MLEKNLKNSKRYAKIFIGMAMVILLNLSTVFAQTNDEPNLQNARVDTSSAGLVTKMAPGDLLPVSTKLLNFGGGKKVDVIITYNIANNKKELIYAFTETVAVETTASFVKNIQIPLGTTPGIYTASASIIYKDQLVPATSEFTFTVENKFFGLFQSDFFLYSGVTIFIGILSTIFGYVLIKRYRRSRLAPLEYTTIPHAERVFYELISDTILQIRQRAGDIALDIAASIQGLEIDKNTGRVLKMTESPSKIIAELVSKYEKTLNQKVSFSFRKKK